MKKAILATKVGMTQIFGENGELTPVTVLQAGPCVVTQVKTVENDGYSAVQVGFVDKREKLVNKCQKGHFEKAGVSYKRYVRELKLDNAEEMKPGEEILISSREGGDYFCRVEELEPEYVSAKILEEWENKELPARIHLFQGLPKGDKMELIIQKAVELGAYRVVPVSMKRSVVKLDAKKADAKRKRWNAVSESAAKQSKRSLIPEVAPLMTYKEAVKEAAGYDMVLLPYESADGIRKTRELLASVKPGTDIAVFIGPEGGFEDEEVELARENGAEIVTLGKRILRTETAGLCMLSALMLQLEV